MSAARIATIGPQCDFIADLATGLLADSQQSGVPLADYLVLLPTRRAARALRAALVPQAGALLLPRLKTLGETDEDALSFAPDVTAEEDVPQAITPLRRRLLLAQLLQTDYDATLTAAGAWQLAGSLASLLDDLLVHQLSPTVLDDIVPDDLASHWQKILTFLQAITRDWPHLLAQEGLVDPVTRQQALVARQIALWQEHPPQTPVVAAGSTASMPATAQLLQVVTQLPRGMVILPGLDLTLPAAEWERLEPSHPQFAMRQWLERCDVPRRQIMLWPSSSARIDMRADFLQTALLPPAATERWTSLPALPAPLPRLALCVTENLAEEALVIALALREALTVPGRTAMLVTRHRALAARVAEQLRRWDIVIDDSAGQSLAELPLGALLQLTVAAASPGATGLDLLALLKHPLVALGLSLGQCRVVARELEIQFWRGHRRRGSAIQQLAALPVGTPQHELLRACAAALQPLTDILQQTSAPLPALLTALAAAAEQLTVTAECPGVENFWRGPAGEALSLAFQTALPAAAGITLRGGDFAAWLRVWLEETALRPAHGLHPRLAILGPLEARLLTADRVIIGGLNDDSWPGAAALDCWLSRPMRQAGGLPLPERQQGQAAHDFVQLASRGDVLLTRARKLDGQPATPSRLLLRLQTVLRAAGRDPAELEEAAQNWLDWARALDKPKEADITPRPPPQPRPAATLRPRRFSVTDIGLWRCNPYGFYAKRLLGLKPLLRLEPDLTQADFGNLVHQVLEDFGRQTQEWPGASAALVLLQTLGQEALADLSDEPVRQATWQVQFSNLASWLVAAEAVRRDNYQPEQFESSGRLSIRLDGMDFELQGRADRIDAHTDGWVVIDYKSGRAPKEKEVAAGYAPQLPLLGLLAERGAFPGLRARPVHELLYYKVGGRGKDGNGITALSEGAVLIAAAETMLHAMLRAFADEAMPYLVTPVPAYVPRHDDYALLARSAEWGAASETDEAA